MRRQIHIRALTNITDNHDTRADIYQQAADNTGFPCWVERYPMPKGADRLPKGSVGERLLTIMDVVEPLSGKYYDPKNCPNCWSLWTERGADDHSPFWREVRRLAALRGVCA